VTASVFVAGTDTGVGKTLVSAALVAAGRRRGQTTVGMKPVASGCTNTEAGLRNADAELLRAAAGGVPDYERVNPYAFAPGIAPHLAARDAGVRIELEVIVDAYESLRRDFGTVVVEGIGGWRVPLGHVLTTEHLAKALDLPVVLVVGMRLGCLNHALLTADAIHSAGLNLVGWVANAVDPAMERLEDNIEALRERLPTRLLGYISYRRGVSYQSLDETINFASFFNE
jgi:dethiobiotin synthetase